MRGGAPPLPEGTGPACAPGMAAPPVSGMLPPRSGSGLPYFKN